MHPGRRYKLYFGPYKTPRFKYGDVVFDERRGDVIIVAISNGRIPWPLARRARSFTRGPVLFKDLARAVRKEAAETVAYWWGVSPACISHWRRALGVKLSNPGTFRLKRELGLRPKMLRNMKRLQKWSRDLGRRSKIAAAKVGRPRPPELIAAWHEGRARWRVTRKVRKKISDGLKRRAAQGVTTGPWAKWEDELLGTLSLNSLVKVTGRGRDAIIERRKLLRAPGGGLVVSKAARAAAKSSNTRAISRG